MQYKKFKLVGTREFLTEFMGKDFHKSAEELYAYAQRLIEAGDLNWTTVLQAAAEKGHSEAAFTMGCLIISNPGCPFTQSDAVRYLETAAEQGHREAMTNLASCLTLGRGVEKDEAKGFRLLQKASELGDHMATYNIAQAYIFGVGVEEDFDKGVKMLISLSERGIHQATDLLSKLGIEKDDSNI